MKDDHRGALQAYRLHARARDLRPKTVGARLRAGARFLEALGDRPLCAATAEDVRGYLAARARVVGSLRHELSSLRCFLRAVLPEGPLPTDGLGPLRPRPRPPVVLSHRGVERLFAVALDTGARGRGFRALRLAFCLRDRALLELLYAVGVRCAEAASVRLVDLDLEQATLLVRRVKGGTSRLLPLPPASVPHLRRYLLEARPALLRPDHDDAGALFLSLRGKPLGTKSIYGLVKKLSKLAGVRAHPHAFRRAVATHLVREGASVLAVKELLGHAHLSTTATYVQVDVEDLRLAVEVLER